MKNISKELIKELSYKSVIYDNVLQIIENLRLCLNEIIIKKNIPVSSNILKIEILNEFATESFTPTSELELAVILNASQLELNTIKINKNKLKKFFKDIIIVWKNNRKKKRRKKKDKEKNILNLHQSKNYTYRDLVLNMQEGLTEYFTEKTLIYNINDKLYIDSREDIGVNIILHFAQSNGENYKIYNNNKFIDINFNRRFINLTYKSVETNRKIYALARIINSLYTSIKNTGLNQILLESCLYNCPNKFFESDDVYCILKETLSFLNNTNINNFKSIVNTDKNIDEEKYIKTSDIENFKNFIKIIKNLITL